MNNWKLNKISIFALILAASITGLSISFYALELQYQTQSSSNFLSNMMGHMIGGMGGMITSAPSIPFYMLILPPVFTSLLILGIIGVLYFFTVPEINISSQVAPSMGNNTTKALQRQKVSTLKKTMKPDERKVLETLFSHGGKYLQKQIAKDANLSRLKTHRIIANFLNRGIVNVRPYGNTNEIVISEWILSDE